VTSGEMHVVIFKVTLQVSGLSMGYLLILMTGSFQVSVPEVGSKLGH